MERVVFEVGDGEGDLCEVRGVGSRLNGEDELALEDEFESLRASKILPVKGVGGATLGSRSWEED